MKRFEKHVVMVSGGARGLGRAICERFVREGAAVVAIDRNEAELSSLAAALGASFVPVVGDVTVYADLERAVETARSRFGRLDTAIANAALFDFGTPLAAMNGAAMGAAFDEVFALNVKGYLFTARAALPALVASRGSIIFTLSSAASHAGCAGVLYTASKHAVVGLVRQLAFELAPHIRVNGVAPGAIRTDLTGPKSLGLEGRTVKELLPPDEVARQFEPLGRFADAAEHVGPYLLLADRTESGTITGHVIEANSGFSIRGITQPAGGWDLEKQFSGK